jgi:thiamine-monophosphate kinase
MFDSATPEFTPIQHVGEFALIDRLSAVLGRPTSPDLLLGIGDDAAVLRMADDRALVWTSDLLTEGIHFDPSYVPLQHLGFKALAVNASDIYAMNARPRYALLALAVSERYSVEALELLYAGLREACRAYGIEIIGGDTTASKGGLVLSLTVLGEAHPDRIVRRSGGRPTDLLVVSGDLGAAYAGLQVLEREKAVWLQNPHLQPDLSDAE